MLNKLPNLDSIRLEILNKGYYVYNNFASSNDCILLREVISKKILKSREYHTRINSNTMPDYTHKRSHDEISRTTRYYSFYHNASKWTDIEKKISSKGIEIRDQIESVWIDKDKEYTKIKSSIQDYNIFTKYNESTGMLPPHRDWPNKLKYPLLQFNLILSQQQIDFNGGEFVFENYNQKNIKIHKDLKMKIGDALLFDKYLLHSVDLTEKGITDIGRWSVLIGARAHKISYFQEKKFLFKEKIKNFIKS